MDWQMIGALGELIGAAGVIASLLYLARQIRYSAKVARRTAVRDLMASFSDFLRELADDEETADLWRRGLDEPEGLSAHEELRLSALILQNVRTWEQVYHWSKADQLEDWMILGNDAIRKAIVSSPGFRPWFDKRKDWISREFRHVLEDELAQLSERNPRSVEEFQANTEDSP